MQTGEKLSGIKEVFFRVAGEINHKFKLKRKSVSLFIMEWHIFCVI